MRQSLRLLSTLQKGRFGTYHLLSPESALTSYPTPRHVPERIPRPHYVPRNFFSAPWSEHETASGPSVETPGGRIAIDADEEDKIRRVGEMAANVLARVKALVQVCELSLYLMTCASLTLISARYYHQ